MALDLDLLEQRIVGALVEKERTVPESYPLTVNALLAAVNQKSNREPQMAVEEYEVEGALRALMEKGWVIQLEREGGRTRRYAHDAERQLGVEAKDMAILAELLNRGPQSPAELKTRASRMVPFASVEDVEMRLTGLAERPVPYVKRLERRPREHAARWMHLLGPVAAPTAGAAGTPSVGGVAPPRAETRSAGVQAARDATDAETADLLGRVETLEQEVADLRTRLDRLEGR